MKSSLLPRSRKKRTPVYQRLIDDIRQWIEEGKLKNEMPLASENQLCESYHLSRKSVRTAIGELVGCGLLHRVAGKGTFVGASTRNPSLRGIATPSHVAIAHSCSTSEENIYKNDAYVSEIVSGIADASAQYGGSLEFLNISSHGSEVILSQLKDRAINGLIWISPSPSDKERLQDLRREKFPQVAVNRDQRDVGEISCVRADNEGGIFKATEYLLRLGHRRIGLLTSSKEISIYTDRLNGYLRALKECGTPVCDDLVVRLSYTASYDETKRLLGSAPPPTAIILGAGSFLAGSLAALSDKGLRIPGDISLIVFDDSSLAQSHRPALTVVRQPLREMGKRSFGLLAHVQNDGSRDDISEEALHTELVVRESCRSVLRPRSSPREPLKQGGGK